MRSILETSLALVLVFLFWDALFLYPLKLLVVFLHESSHALMTVITGGEVLELVIDQNQGGYVSALGGNRFLVLSAGYLGSILWGAVIVILASYSRQDKILMGILGSIICLITLIYGKGLFVFLFGIGLGMAMIASAIYVNEAINDSILRFIGFVNLMYVPLDIYSDTIARSHLRSDARMLAEEFGGTTLLWGSIWIVISTLIVILTLKFVIKHQRQQQQASRMRQNSKKSD